MNTRIAQHLRNASPEALEGIARSITDTHNLACRYGFLDLPLMEFISAEREDNVVYVCLRPAAQMAKINDIYNLQTEWGAAEVTFYISGIEGHIELVFKA